MAGSCIGKRVANRIAGRGLCSSSVALFWLLGHVLIIFSYRSPSYESENLYGNGSFQGILIRPNVLYILITQEPNIGIFYHNCNYIFYINYLMLNSDT